MDRDITKPVWTERYRPQTVSSMILPAYLKKSLNGMVAAREIPNIILSGGPGVGKTTAAMAMLNEIKADYYKLNASLDGNIDTLRNQVLQFASTVSFVGGRKYVFLDEADYLTYATQPPLRGIIEDVSTNCGFIFSVNYPERIIEPLRSRCPPLEFKIPPEEAIGLKKEFYRHVSAILELENVPFEKKVVAQVVDKFFPDMRKALNELQHYSNSGAIDNGILAVMKDASLTDLLDAMKEKNFSAVRVWVNENINVGSPDIFRKIYDTARDMVTLESVPSLVVLLGKYQYQAAFAADPEINMAAAIAEIMVSCSFR